jgi:hypothetical protein
MWRHSSKKSFKFLVPFALMLLVAPSSCATGRYVPLGEAGATEIEQLKENVYPVEYQASSFTSQEQLDRYLRPRCAELTLREGVRLLSPGSAGRRAGPLTPYGHDSDAVQRSEPAGVADLYDAKYVLAEPASVPKND